MVNKIEISKIGVKCKHQQITFFFCINANNFDKNDGNNEGLISKTSKTEFVDNL